MILAILGYSIAAAALSLMISESIEFYAYVKEFLKNSDEFEYQL